MLNVGINGFGRIGKSLFRIITENKDSKIKVSAIKDYNSFSVSNDEYLNNIAYLLENDSIYGQFPASIDVDGQNIIINGIKIPVFLEKNIKSVDWNKLGCDILIEASGTINNINQVKDTFGNNVKKAIITRGGLKNVDYTYVKGVNDSGLKLDRHHIISSSTCTGNAFAPFANFIDENYGVIQGSVCTIHPVLSSEKMIDGFNKSFQLGRAGKSVKLIPTAITSSVLEVLPNLKGKIIEKSLSYRIPTDIVSSVYGVLLLKKHINKKQLLEELNLEIKDKLDGVIELCKGSFGHSKVSIDYLKNKHSAIIDEDWIQVDGNLLQFHLWHDNEYGYSMRVFDLIKKISIG